MSGRIVRAVIFVFVVACAAGSSIASEVRQGVPDRPAGTLDEVPSRAKCSNDVKSTSDDETRVEALLSKLDPASVQAAEAVPILLAALRDFETDSTLRERSAAMLARIGEPARAAVPILIEILERSQQVISPIPDGTTGEERSTREDTRYWAMKSLGVFGSVAADAVPIVAQFLTSAATTQATTQATSPQLRVLAADTLGQIRTSAAIGVLTAELMKPRRTNNYESIVLRQTIIDGLASAGPLAVGAIPALGRAAEDDNADIRRKACEALGSLGSRAEGGMNSLLERLILDEDAAVKDAAANALAQIGQPAVASLVDLLERGDPELQWRAAKALGQVGPVARPAAESLKLAFDIPSTQVRIEAIDAVWKISRDPQAVATALVKILSEDERQIRRRASGMLVELEPLPRDTSVALKELAANGGANERRAAEYVIRERSRKASQQ